MAGIGDQDVGGSLARPGQAVGEGGREIESVLVVNRTVRPWARSHRTVSGAPGTTWLPTYSMPSRTSSSTVSMPVSRPTTHLRHVRLDHPGKATGPPWRSFLAVLEPVDPRQRTNHRR